jgi:hypothetical protein
VLSLGDLMKRLVEFPLDQGGSILVEVEEPAASPTMRGLEGSLRPCGSRPMRPLRMPSRRSLPRPVSLIARLRSIDDPSDEVGVEPSAQTGTFIASVAAQANFRVSLTWRRDAVDT